MNQHTPSEVDHVTPGGFPKEEWRGRAWRNLDSNPAFFNSNGEATTMFVWPVALTSVTCTLLSALLQL